MFAPSMIINTKEIGVHRNKAYSHRMLRIR